MGGGTNPIGVRPDSVAGYPRVGGGTVVSRVCSWPVGGLSPRGRGNRNHPVRLNEKPRSIPAWAGEPAQLDPVASPE